jgi:hypothetical protein
MIKERVKMKKAALIKKGTVALVVFMIAAISLFGCKQGGGGDPPAQSEERGTLRVIFDFTNAKAAASIAALNNGRTVHPVIASDTFDKYMLKFEPKGSGAAAHDAVQVSVNQETGVVDTTVQLAVGTYDITAEGYKGSEIIAQGTIGGVGVSTGANAEAKVVMVPNTSVGGTGDFYYNITVPGGVNSALLTLTLDGEPVGSAVTLTAGQANTGTKESLATGTYYVFVQLTDSAGSTAGLAEILHIYKGLTSNLTKTYTSSDFAPPQVISAFDLTSFFPAPVSGAAPVTTFGTTSSQYTGAIQWKTGGNDFTGSAFAASTSYSAVVSLTPNPGYTLTGVAANSFTHTNATSKTHEANSGVVTLVFLETGAATGTPLVVIGFDGDITINMSAVTMYNDGRTPNSITLSVANYENGKWYIDGSQTAIIENPVTLNAANYTVQSHTASFFGTKNGTEYSQSVSFTVEGNAGTPGNNPGGPSGSGDDPVDNIEGIPPRWLLGMELDLSGGAGSPVQVLPATAANKAITWTVTEAEAGTGVSTGALSGGKFTPSGKGTVILSAVITDGLGTGDYTKEDIEITIGDVLLYKKSGSNETVVDVTYDDFDGAMTYINEEAAANEQYVVLVGADQEIAPYISPADEGKAGIEITLRGYGAERKISWDGTTKTSISGSSGLFALDNGAALILDNYITLDGKNTAITFPSNEAKCSMIYMKNAHLRMKTGSKITSFSATATPVVKTQTNASITGSITLEGGEISGNTGGDYDVYITGSGAAPGGYTFTMSGGAIKNNTGKGGVYLANNVRGTMSGGEISGYASSTITAGYGIYCSSGYFTMEGGKISNNRVGIYFTKTDSTLTMTGGEISNNGAQNSPIGGGIRIIEDTSSLLLNGPVTFTNNTISLEKYNSNGVVYLGSGFSSSASNITLTLASPNDYFMEDWGVNRTILKGGTPGSQVSITETQKAKISVNAAIGEDNNAMTEKTDGSVSLTWSGNPVVGVTKWTAN